jgi:hypothetical protein
MTDLNVVAKVSRGQLGLGDLDINDHSSYVLAGGMTFGGAVQWNRKQLEVPWVDGQVTVERHRTNVTEPLSVYVAGSSIAELDTRLGTLISAFHQDRFTFQLVVGGANHAWDCEAADIQQVLYDNVHVYNRYVTVTFAVPRKPIPLAGAF